MMVNAPVQEHLPKLKTIPKRHIDSIGFGLGNLCRISKSRCFWTRTRQANRKIPIASNSLRKQFSLWVQLTNSRNHRGPYESYKGDVVKRTWFNTIVNGQSVVAMAFMTRTTYPPKCSCIQVARIVHTCIRMEGREEEQKIGNGVGGNLYSPRRRRFKYGSNQWEKRHTHHRW